MNGIRPSAPMAAIHRRLSGDGLVAEDNLTPILESRSITVQRGAELTLCDASLHLLRGTIVGLIGPNGAGKTTLIRALAGLQPINSGEVLYQGKPLVALSADRRAREIAYMPQDRTIHWPLAARAVVALGRVPHRGVFAGLGIEDRAAIDSALISVDATSLAARPVTELSGGERTRVLLARLIAQNAPVILADEPTAGLDPGHMLEVMARFQSLAASGHAVLIALHDLTLAARVCDFLVLLDGGRVAAKGRADAVLTPDRLARHYGVRAHFAVVEGGPVIAPIGRIKPVESALTSPSD